MRKKVIDGFILIIILLIHFDTSWAYSKAVHERITDEAIQQNLGKINKSISDYTGLMGVDEKIKGQTIKKWIKDGSWLEDIGIDILTSHFYNPLTNKGLSEMGVIIGESAYDRDNNSSNPWSWKMAREYFYSGLTAADKTTRDINLSHAFEALGHAVHLVQDVAVPAHTRDDMHMPAVDGEPYEAYTNNYINNLNYLLVPFSYWNASISPFAPKHFWDLDTYTGATAYDSGYIGLSEYTNANFYSKDSIGDEETFPHPKRDNTNFVDDFGLFPVTVVTTPDGVTHNTFYVTGYGKEHLAALKYFAEEILASPIPLPIKKFKMALFLDDECHKEYAQYLVPLAVGYSAGLLNYFFRGQIDLELDPDNPGMYVIKNDSGENMSGTFGLYYDDKTDTRRLITSWNFSIDANAQSPSVMFTPPSDAKEPCKYMLVFKGQMGQEQNAVVGKRVSAGSCILGRTVRLNIDREIYSGGQTFCSHSGSLILSTQSGNFFGNLPHVYDPYYNRSVVVQLIRFDQDNWDAIIVMTRRSVYSNLGQLLDMVYDFHKFDFDGDRVNYAGIIKSVPGNYSSVSTDGEGVKVDEWHDYECPAQDEAWDFHVFNTGETRTIHDFYVKGGNINLFTKYRKEYSEGYQHRYLVRDSDTCQPFWEHGDGSSTYVTVKQEIKYGDSLIDQSFSECRQPKWNFSPCPTSSNSTGWVPAYRDIYPYRVLNESDSLYIENGALKSSLNFPVTSVSDVMIRNDSGYSFFNQSQSFSPEIEASDCGGFLIANEDKAGFYVSGNRIKLVKYQTCSNYNILAELGENITKCQISHDYILKNLSSE